VIADSSPLTFEDPFVLICAFIVGVLAVTRMTRLLVDDDFPPTLWLRKEYLRRTNEAWGLLVECPWCMSVWVTLIDLGWAWISDLHWTWWLANTWFAVAWLAAFLNLRDIPKEDR
jgi:hypothetical protein